MFKKYIGNKDYYKKLLAIAFPLALTNLLQSCMSIVDTVMVSGIGMVTAVGNAGNIVTLNNGISWGIISGIAVYAAQFYGANQKDNLARTYGLCLSLMLTNALIWILVVFLFGKSLLQFYLNDLKLIEYSYTYIRVAIFSLLFEAFNFSSSIMFRSMHNTRLPFVLSTFAALLNILINYICIYVFNMGVVGAAYGTVLSNAICFVVYLFIIIKSKPLFFDISKMFDLHISFVRPVLDTMIPIIINESIFGFGQSLFNKAYGLLGTKAMDAIYVANQVFNMFTFAIWGFGSAVSILVGTKLGEGKIDEAIKESKWQLGSGFMLGLFVSILMISFSGLYLKLFNINDLDVYVSTQNILYVYALKLFIRTFTYMMFSTLKAGGDSKIINLYDSGFIFLIGLPLAFLGAFIGIKNIALLVLLAQVEQVIRFIFVLKRYNSNIWAKDLTTLVNN